MKIRLKRITKNIKEKRKNQLNSIKKQIEIAEGIFKENRTNRMKRYEFNRKVGLFSFC